MEIDIFKKFNYLLLSVPPQSHWHTGGGPTYRAIYVYIYNVVGSWGLCVGSIMELFSC